MAPTAALIFFFVCCLSTLRYVFGGKSEDGYFHGRATFYDDNQQGACQYFGNIPEYYAAWPDTQEGFGISCGTCWEIQCVDDSFSDGYGEHIDRSGACKDPSKKVVVKIVDACPCEHYNYYSNKRWCCGDQNHIDLGRKAYSELADEHWGVIGLKWRETSCDRIGVVEGSWASASSSASSAFSQSASSATASDAESAGSNAGFSESSSGSWSSDGSSGSSSSSSATSGSTSGSSSAQQNSGSQQHDGKQEWGLGAFSGVLSQGSQAFQNNGWNWNRRRRLMQ